MIRVETTRFEGALGAEMRHDRAVPALYWLGQAGFLLTFGSLRVLVDPYLSDHLAAKYREKGPSHERLASAPITVEEFDRIDWILCTHRHGDHMDPDFLPEAARRFPQLCFLVPATEREHALSLGLPAERVRTIGAGERLMLGDFAVEALPAAHEERERDAEGRDRYLGYAVSVAGMMLYHSGDTVPFDELAERVAALRPDIALLPVNGRGKGVPGNMTLEEAVALCRRCGIGHLVPHHFGMFAFNTLETEAIDRMAQKTSEPRITRPAPDMRIDLKAA